MEAGRIWNESKASHGDDVAIGAPNLFLSLGKFTKIVAENKYAAIAVEEWKRTDRNDPLYVHIGAALGASLNIAYAKAAKEGDPRAVYFRSAGELIRIFTLKRNPNLKGPIRLMNGLDLSGRALEALYKPIEMAFLRGPEKAFKAARAAEEAALGKPGEIAARDKRVEKERILNDWKGKAEALRGYFDRDLVNYIENDAIDWVRANPGGDAAARFEAHRKAYGTYAERQKNGTALPTQQEFYVQGLADHPSPDGIIARIAQALKYGPTYSALVAKFPYIKDVKAEDAKAKRIIHAVALVIINPGNRTDLKRESPIILKAITVAAKEIFGLKGLPLGKKLDDLATDPHVQSGSGQLRRMFGEIKWPLETPQEKLQWVFAVSGVALSSMQRMFIENKEYKKGDEPVFPALTIAAETLRVLALGLTRREEAFQGQ